MSRKNQQKNNPRTKLSYRQEAYSASKHPIFLAVAFLFFPFWNQTVMLLPLALCFFSLSPFCFFSVPFCSDMFPFPHPEASFPSPLLLRTLLSPLAALVIFGCSWILPMGPWELWAHKCWSWHFLPFLLRQQQQCPMAANRLVGSPTILRAAAAMLCFAVRTLDTCRSSCHRRRKPHVACQIPWARACKLLLVGLCLQKC